MNGLFEALAADDSDRRRIARQALVLSDIRIEKQYGDFLRQSKTAGEFDARLSYVDDDFQGIIHVACAEVGHEHPEHIVASLRDHLRPTTLAPRTASLVIEARRPRMCPYHTEVTAISLAQGEPRAGYDSMAQHAFGTNHCQNSEYEGASCKFKPEMTTQGYWDTRQQTLQEKREQRQELQEQQLDQPEFETSTETPEFDAPESDSAEVIDFPGSDQGDEAGGLAEGLTEAPEAMPIAASTRTAHRTAEEDHKMVTCPVCGGKNEKCSRCHGKGRVADWGKSTLDAVSKTAADDQGFGGPEPKMDKRLWTPENVKPIDLDDTKGRWPTKTKDIIEPIVAENSGELEEIGKQKTERWALPSSDNAGFTTEKNTEGSGPTRTFPKGKHADPVTAKADDIHKNPIETLLEDNFGVPESAVKNAVATYR